MRTLLATLLALAALVSAGCGGEDRRRPAAKAARPTDGVLGILCDDCRDGAVLTRIDPLTLRPLSGRKLAIGAFAGHPIFSPDGRRLALADIYGTGAIRLADTRSLRFGWSADIGDRLSALAWLRPERIVALVGQHPPGALEARVIDPGRRNVSPGDRIAGPVWARESIASARHLVVLLGRPAAGTLPATELAIVNTEGRVRRVVLEEIRTGLLEDAGVGRWSEPGLAVDPQRERAVVVAASAPVAEIDLETGAVSYHELSRPVGLLGRLRDWLDPAALAKGPVEGPVRHAVWLRNGLIAVTGEDHHVARRPDTAEEGRIVPAGLHLIDPDDWSIRTLHERAASVAVGGGTLLAWTFPMESVPERLRRIGLTAYTLAGERRFELFPGKGIWDLQVAGRYAYARRSKPERARHRPRRKPAGKALSARPLAAAADRAAVAANEGCPPAGRYNGALHRPGRQRRLRRSRRGSHGE